MDNQGKNIQDSKLSAAITKRRVVEITLLLLVVLGLSWFVIFNESRPGWDFRNNLWAPSYLLLNGQSPYKIEVLYALGNAVWMPMVIGAFFPLGFLPLQQASNLWLVVNALGIIFLTWISSGFRRPAILKFTIALLAAFLFLPLISHLRLGQFSIGITLLFLVVVIWYGKLPVLLSAVLLAIALAKPQLVIFVLPGFLFSHYRNNNIRDTIRFVGLLLAGSLVLTVPLFIADPNWYVDFIAAFQQNPSWKHPSTLVTLTSLTGRFGLIIWIVFAVIAFISNIWLWAKLPNRIAVLWSLALTPLVTPYVWSWDFVMILPLFISLLFRVKGRAFWFLIMGYLICWLLMLKTALGNNVSDYSYWYVSWILVGTIIGATIVVKQENKSLAHRL
jgi:hypothetical protein